MIQPNETTVVDYYGTGGGSDIDPLTLKLLSIGLERTNPTVGLSGAGFVPGSEINLDDYMGISYLGLGLDSVQTTTGANDLTATVEMPNSYEDTDYQDVTNAPTSQTAAPTASVPTNASPCNCVTTPCNCAKTGDKPDSLSVEYWKGWATQQARSSRVWGTAILMLFIYLAYRAGKNG